MHRLRGLVFCLLQIGLAGHAALAQDVGPLVENADTAYYDFWVGTWLEEKDGVVDTSGSRFTIVPSVHPAAFEERWRLFLDDGTELHSTALRAWDNSRPLDVHLG